MAMHGYIYVLWSSPCLSAPCELRAASHYDSHPSPKYYMLQSHPTHSKCCSPCPVASAVPSAHVPVLVPPCSCLTGVLSTIVLTTVSPSEQGFRLPLFWRSLPRVPVFKRGALQPRHWWMPLLTWSGRRVEVSKNHFKSQTRF